MDVRRLHILLLYLISLNGSKWSHGLKHNLSETQSECLPLMVMRSNVNIEHVKKPSHQFTSEENLAW